YLCLCRIIIRMQTAEDERKKALEKDEKLQREIKDLRQRLEQTESELTQLKSHISTLEAQIEADTLIKKELEDRIQTLKREKQGLIDKEMKDQEGLKTQYQRLMKERLNEERKQFEIKLKANHNKTPSISSTRSSLDSNSTLPTTILVERLQSNIRQLENQISFYQTQLSSSSQSRDELSEEVLSMSQEIEQLRKEVKRTKDLETQHQQLDSRYQTLLELLGERTEQVEELKADLQDVKEMYKSQIIDLVQKLDQLRKK
ncbi:TATA element modulatory factor 1 TATA binding-domain-containing protein, partial [Gilbertella persicaria]|uniref:TATA element modulatory factor 1 TATA binding-domain-containing protein n=1 Tax=Gilbertella persicaria TaxID=101096 RepID=UPI00221EC787